MAGNRNKLEGGLMRTSLSLHYAGLISICIILLFSNFIFSQDGNFAGTKVVVKNNQIATQTIPSENTSGRESLDEHLSGFHLQFLPFIL